MTIAPTRTRRHAVLAAALTMALGGAVVVQASESSAAVIATADWQLQNNRASAVPGAPALTNIGGGNTFVSANVDGTAGRRVLSYPAAGGLQVAPLTGLVTPGVYSVVMLYKPATLSGYQRLLDLNNGVGETGLYTLNGSLIAYPQAPGTLTPITTTAFHQVVLTRTAGKVVKGYVDGDVQFTFTDTSNAWLAGGPNMRFFKDNSTEEGAGQVARIRLFKTALTAGEVASLDRLPVNTADLAVSLVDAPDPVERGKLFAYTATVTDNGPTAAAGTSLTFTLPTGATVVGSSPSVGSCAAPVSNHVTCSLGALAPGASANVLLVMNAPGATGSKAGSVSVTSSTTDSNTVNNSDSVTTRVR